MRLVRTSLGLLVSLALLVATPARADDTSPLDTVRIEARLDPARHVVRGEVVYALRNVTRAPLDTLVFHLYLEAFRNERSVFMRESGGSLRGVLVDGDGGEIIERLTVDGVDVLGGAERQLVPDDFTQLRVRLARPLAVGATATVRVEFTSHLPALAARAGYLGDFHVLAQWYPKLAKLEPDGTWASFPYHGNGEFYADFARYEVALSVPSDYQVEGTGGRAATVRRGTSTVHRFAAAPVHDAAYVVGRRLTTLERHCAEVDLRVAHPPGYAAAAEEHARATCFGLERFGAWFGAYPYPTLTVVVPPRGAEGGAGMEYPTAFLTDGPWFASSHLPYSPGVETTFHELAHQWFQGIVASNEDRYPVLDEGLASFVGYEGLAAFRGHHQELFYESLRPYVARGNLPPPSLPSDRFSAYEYGASVYGRSAAVLETLARRLGHANVLRALGRYARDQRFAHPRPAALLAAFEAELGKTPARWLGEMLLDGRRVVTWVERGRDGTLRARRRGITDFPIDVTIREGSRTRRVRWADSNDLVVAPSPAGRRQCIVVDPDRRSLLDDRRSDDVACTRSEEPRLRALLFAAIAVALRGIGP